MPTLEPDVPAQRWRLGDAGRAAAAALRPLLPAGVMVSSDEPKALETAKLVCAARSSVSESVVVDVGLREVARPAVWSADHIYREQASAYVAGEPIEGWEPHEAVAARFGTVVEAYGPAAAALGMPLLLVGHGLAPTVWLTSIGRLDDPVAFWSGLRFPDAVLVPREPYPPTRIAPRGDEQGAASTSPHGGSW